MDRDRENPALQLVLELVAEAMELGAGRQRLELVFVDGRLERWWAHAENRPAADLSLFEPAGSSFAEALLGRVKRSAT